MAVTVSVQMIQIFLLLNCDFISKNRCNLSVKKRYCALFGFYEGANSYYLGFMKGPIVHYSGFMKGPIVHYLGLMKRQIVHYLGL